MNEFVAFLDEWGNNGLDFTKPGRAGVPVSTHFIVVAITLSKEQLAEAESQLEAIRSRFFQTGPIKSAKVRSDDKRRLLILKQLVNVPFQIFALVVDKRELRGQGLYYKGSFYKFLHGLADRELYRSFPNLELVADRHSDENFIDGFVQYVYNRHVPTLFNQASFRFVNSQASLLVQAADFVAGSLARRYDETVLSAKLVSIGQLLQSKLKYWPDVFAPLVAASVPDQTTHNLQEIDQVTWLQYLLFHFCYVDSSRYISSRELLAHIEERRGNLPTLHYFQTRIIAPLRDAGLLIASSGKGYKTPACEDDLYDFVNHSDTIIQLISKGDKLKTNPVSM